MRYPGGKGGAGVAQTIVNQIPPHRVYLEPFVGGGAVFRAKAPAASSVLNDLDPAVAEHWRRSTTDRADVEVLHGCALELLSSFPWRGDEFVYLDPPYHPDSRACASIYRCEMDDGGHRALLAMLERLPVRWALSGYRCVLYAGSDFRDRQRIKRKVERWLAKLDALEPVERNALLSAMGDRYGLNGGVHHRKAPHDPPDPRGNHPDHPAR
jgi:DNA adenine methylase